MNVPSTVKTAAPRVLVLGAGFGGLEAARRIAEAMPAARVLLLDRHNYHTFTPLLYQVATATLEPEEILYPVRAMLRRHRNIAFKVAQVSGIDLAGRLVQTERTNEPYDYLIVATGSTTNFFGLPGVAERSFGLKDLPEALALRNQLLGLFERALEEQDRARRRDLLTLLIAGGGPTGVELAGAFSELIRLILAHDYPSLDPTDVRIVLIEGADRLLGAFRPGLSRSALRRLRQKGVEVLLQRQVVRLDEQGVLLQDGTEIRTSLIVWAAGVRAVDLSRDLSASLGRGGRVPVLPTLQLPNHPEVYVIGDMAELRQNGEILPMLAPVALQEGRLAAMNIARQVTGQRLLPFHYADRGTMATIGRSAAVAQVGPLSLTGFPAWLAWLGLHIVELIGFRNRLLVLVNWAWDYLFFERGVRVITEPLRVDQPSGGSQQS
ncbi:MAG: NAD(P)/FAD-dependent oxidoreductase, partial [Dehalococcoidia bacterium]